jgi:hypothetical protein
LGGNWENGRAIILASLRCVACVNAHKEANPGSAGGLRSSRPACSSPEPIPSPFHLCHSSHPSDTLVNTTLSSLSTLIKRFSHKYTFQALASYSSLSVYRDRWDGLITRCAERKENERKENLHARRGVCLRSFPGLLAGLKLAGLGRGGGVCGGGTDFTILVRLPLILQASIVTYFCRRRDTSNRYWRFVTL